MKIFFCLMLLVAPLCAGQIIIDGTMSLVWQYDLTTNQFTNVQVAAMPVHVVINEVTPTGGIGNYNIGSVLITESLYTVSTPLYNSVSISNEPSGTKPGLRWLTTIPTMFAGWNSTPVH